MKKVYVNYSSENGYELARNDGTEAYTLYSGIDEIYGGWMVSTSGDPCTLNDLEEADNTEREIKQILEILADDSTPWESTNAEDAAYVHEWLRIWGLL